MAAAWEVWTLWWLAAFQIAVAVWWWRGEHLEGTKVWVPLLFVLNGGITLARSAGVLGAGRLAKAIPAALDGWTWLALLAITLVAFVPENRHKRPRFAILGIAAVSVAVVSPDRFLKAMGELTVPSWFSLAALWPAYLAAFVAGGAVLRRTVSEDLDLDLAWTLVLSVLLLRFTELWFRSVYGFSGLRTPLLWAGAVQLPRIATGLFLLVVFLALVSLRLFGSPKTETFHTDIVLAFLVAGFLLAVARTGGGADAALLAVLFSMSFLRPLCFAGAQATLHPRGYRESSTLRWTVLGGVVLAVSLLGLAAGSAWASDLGIRLVVAAAFGLLSLPFLRVAFERIDLLERPEDGIAGSTRAADRLGQRIEDDRVALPDDWESRLQEGLDRFRTLADDTKEHLQELSRWQRIMLALHASPKENRIPRYERTTPGLHLLTQCPYSNIGPEIQRTNDRWETVLQELGLDPPSSGGVDPDEPLIESTWGPAEGLQSNRAKSYRLTELGERVAERMRDRLGLTDLSDESLRRVIGEAYADHLRT